MPYLFLPFARAYNVTHPSHTPLFDLPNNMRSTNHAAPLTSCPDTQISVFSCDQSVNKIKTKTVETCGSIKQYVVSVYPITSSAPISRTPPAPSRHMSRLHTSNISERCDDPLSPYLLQCYCAQRTFQAVVGSDKIAAEPTGLSFTPYFMLHGG
jgi:hypothetical protein